jgi:hypothetical protein
LTSITLRAKSPLTLFELGGVNAESKLLISFVRVTTSKILCNQVNFAILYFFLHFFRNDSEIILRGWFAENAVAPFWDGRIWRSLKPSSVFQLRVSSMLASENSKPSLETRDDRFG